MDASIILFILVVFQLAFLGIYLLGRQNGSVISNRLLGLFFFAICLNLLDVLLLQTGVYFNHPRWAGLGSCLPLCFGPLLYLYVRSIVSPYFAITGKTAYHFLPFVFAFAGAEIYYQNQPDATQQGILVSLSIHQIPAVLSVTSALIFLQFFVYSGISFRLVAQYKKRAAAFFSNPKNVDFSWLYSAILFFMLIAAISLLNSLLSQTAFARFYLVAFNIAIILLLLFVMRIMMKALNQPSFLSFTNDTETKETPKRTGYIDAEKTTLFETAQAFMEAHKPYLDPDLTLEQLAVKLSVKPRALSQAINNVQQQNFFDFINRYRIDEAKRMLTNPADKKLTILEVLYATGFNSKSSFNTLFKKYSGFTPTEFRKQQQQ